MDRWQGRVAVVTGASAGIGAAIARALVKEGLTVIGMARRVEKMQILAQRGAMWYPMTEEIAHAERVLCPRRLKIRKGMAWKQISKLLEGEKGKMVAIECDVADPASVVSAFKTVDDSFGGADILINNAGILVKNTLLDGSVEAWSRIMAVNVIGLCHCTKIAIDSMKRRGVDDGHIIHISSITAHVVPENDRTHFYSASKHAVKALTEGLRKELRDKKSNIRVTSISPGLVKSDIYEVSLGSTISNLVYSSMPSLEAEDVAEAVVNALATKPHVQVHDVLLKPIGEAI